MTGPTLFRKYFGVSALIVLGFALLGLLASMMVRRLADGHPPGGPAELLARLVDSIGRGDRPRAIDEARKASSVSQPFELLLLDSGGRVLHPPGASHSLDWGATPKPAEPYAHLHVEEGGSSGGSPGNNLVLLPGSPPQYLYARFGAFPGPRQGALFMTFGALIASVLAGVAVSVLVHVRSFRRKAELADRVIGELQAGNLKARFPIRRSDELTRAMCRFNSMAEEIERLVERLRSVERSRMTLLQDLAHDLRTPIASLKNLLETLGTKQERMAPEVRAELLALALRETEYFERLVEDLLVLAQVSEPRYRAGSEGIELGLLIREEAEAASARSGVRVSAEIREGSLEVEGDAQLLRRMARNLLENSLSFARSAVRASLGRDEATGEAVLTVEDDGPGFSAEALAAFGERRVSRALGSAKDGRLSVGLGSVIVRTVATLHRGSVRAENRVELGRVVGARVRVRLPARKATQRASA